MNAIQGTTALRGVDHTDNLVNMLIAIITLARKDSAGSIKGVPATQQEYWREDAVAFLQSINELKQEIIDREWRKSYRYN